MRLERQVGTVCRKVARRIVAEEIRVGPSPPRRSAAIWVPHATSPILTSPRMTSAAPMGWPGRASAVRCWWSRRA